MCFFRNECKMKDHEMDCKQQNKCKIILPTQDNQLLRFENHNKKELVPVIVYADFECLVKPREDGQHERIVSNNEAFSIGFYVKYTHDFENAKSEYEVIVKEMKMRRLLLHVLLKI